MGYIGYKESYPIVMDGLKKLEYRGYDSAGVAIMNGSLSVYKKQGKVQALENYTEDQNKHGNIAIGHTRWATHGLPNDKNAHPHVSASGRLVMVHNGIIENYDYLKKFLLGKGFEFKSDTDSEVLLQYFEWYQENYDLTLYESVRRALGDIVGTYAIAVLDTHRPDALVVAKQGSPLVIGLSKQEFYIASDANPISSYCKDVLYMNDGEIAILNKNGGLQLSDLDRKILKPEIVQTNCKDADYSLDDYDTYMLKEIHQQPESIAACISGRVNIEKSRIQLEAIENHVDNFSKANRIVTLGCGTSWHAGLIGEYMIEKFAGIPVEVEYASEFRYRSPIIQKNDIVIAISQSGETADTLAAVKMAKQKGAFIYSLINTPESSIARSSDAVSYLRIGAEISVASTKAFTAQVTLLYMIALKMAEIKNTVERSQLKGLLEELNNLPAIIQEVYECNEIIKTISKKYFKKDHALFLGRGINFPTALEGALKLKEISYIHAEGYPAAEMKHGPIALVNEELPVFVVANSDDSFEKLISNVQEIKSRKGEVIIIKHTEQKLPCGLADFVVNVPKVNQMISPIVSSIPLQLLSYHISKMRGCDIDQPRNLAKSVTVE